MRARGLLSPSAIAIALAASAALAPDAFANCADVNAGAFDRTAYTPPGSGVLDTSTGFAVGDEITVIVSGLTGSSFELLNGALDTALLTQPLSGSPATVSYTVTGSNSDTTLHTYMLVQAIPYEITIAASCVAGGGGAVDTSQAAVRAFLASRIDGILLNDPSATSLIHRSDRAALRQAAGPGSGVLGYAAGDSDGSASVRFSETLETASPWGAWIDGRYSAFIGDLGRSHVGLVSVGGDYRVTEDMMVGMLAQFDWAGTESSALSSRVEGSGWMIGPYMSTRIHDNIYLDLRAAWGRSSNDLAAGGATGDFDTTRWLLKGALSGNWTHGSWRMTPAAEIAYGNESASAFTDSADTFVPGVAVSLGRLQFGPEIGYRFGNATDAVIEPFAAIKGVWDFHDPNVAIVEGYVGRSFRGRLQGGLNVMTASGIHVRGLASWDGLGAAGHNGFTLQGTVSVPLD